MSVKVKGELPESIFSFNHVDLEGKTQVISKCIYPLVHLANLPKQHFLQIFFLKPLRISVLLTEDLRIGRIQWGRDQI